MSGITSSLPRILAGARLVAQAGAKQTADKTAVTSSRLVEHGIDLALKARATSQEVINGASISSPESHDVDRRSATPNPYESQLTATAGAQLPPPNGQSATSSISNEAEFPNDVPNPYLYHISKDFDYEEYAKVKRKDQAQSPQHIPQDIMEESHVSEESGIDESAVSLPVRLKEGRDVPSTRFARAAGFASLGAGLAWGSISQLAARAVGIGRGTPIVANDANADRLAASLCRMRGAALKLGQMLSIQDESLLPPALSRALKTVRQGADAMPKKQLFKQLESQLGEDWRTKFTSLDETPFAAASIGQVHKATIVAEDGSSRDVVVKVQYPGVAESIESDLRNMTMLVKMTGLAPRGLFIDNVIRVGRDELKVECNYLNEMANQRKMKELVASDPFLVSQNFVVPDVIEELTTEEVITSSFAAGGTIDNVSSMSQAERNRIGTAILYLTMKELFEWRLMQTDPNWGNFLYDVGSRQTSLIDFGATRSYSKEFVDGYLRIVWANANRDEITLMDLSHKMGFLTGEENREMREAHKQSGFTVGEPFAESAPFDFRASNISSRMSAKMSTFLKHRLTPPPEEVYTLHRKLAGAYMLCIKLGSVINCRELLEDIITKHEFEDGMPHPMQA